MTQDPTPPTPDSPANTNDSARGIPPSPAPSGATPNAGASAGMQGMEGQSIDSPAPPHAVDPRVSPAQTNRDAQVNRAAPGCGCGCGSTSAPESCDGAASAQPPFTWVDAFLATPGPRTWREAGILWAKGVCMGTADIIPGVSGGTIAFITGIYESFLNAIASVDLVTIRQFFSGSWKACLSRIHLRFLLVLLCGIGVAIVSTARIVHYVIEYHPVQTWSFFFGLIVASAIILAKEVKGWSVARVGLLVGGIVFAWWMTGLIPVETPRALWFIFLCGVVSICAMVLPGLSGSFLLVILGQYFYITGMIKDPFVPAHMLVILVFMSGWVVGIAGFSRFLKWLLARRHEATMCVLTGFLIGALRKVWPWKHPVEVLETEKGGRVLAEVLRWPWTYTEGYTPRVYLQEGLERVPVEHVEAVRHASAHLPEAVGLAVLGVVLVLVLEWWANRLQGQAPTEPDLSNHTAG